MNNYYCSKANNLPLDNINRIYHDTIYGFPAKTDNELFGRLILEINQAGLSWNTILKKKKSIEEAFSQFNITEIANYNNNKIESLLKNKKIIRNKLKINAIIYNAKRIQILQNEYGSFKNWLDTNKTLNFSEWVSIFKKNFKFTGNEITKEFLISTGYIKGAHSQSCNVFHKINKIHKEEKNKPIK